MAREDITKDPKFNGYVYMCYMSVFDGWEETYTELNLQRKRNRKSCKRLPFKWQYWQRVYS